MSALHPQKPLSKTHPEIAATADGWDPTLITAKSGKRLPWKCPLGHQWVSIVSNRTTWTGCPVCSGRKVLQGTNDLATKDPMVAAEADGWDPTTVTVSSNKRRQWKCQLGHRWIAKVQDRTGQDRTGCPYCSGRLPIVGINDLATTHPSIAKMAHGWNPSEVKATSGRRKEWQCLKGHIWKVCVADLTAATEGKGCPYCSNKKVQPSFNDLATTHPHLLSEIDGWDPSKITIGHNKKVGWKCTFGHQWNAVPRAKMGCPVCGNRMLLVGFNDLQTAFPEIAAEADGWDPQTLVAVSFKKRTWKCELGHRWRAAVRDRTGSDKTACPACAKHGFNPDRLGWIYFLRHEDWQMYQIGISNSPEIRLSHHDRIGWTTWDLRGPMEGMLARSLETAILRALRARGAKFANKSSSQRFDGWSEAWMQSSLKVKNIAELIEFVYQDDSEN